MAVAASGWGGDDGEGAGENNRSHGFISTYCT